ncbi:MAG: flagellar hook-length control protein FliK, partial [Syntrophorhabdaceae bacterium]|nr:flagellar hook-length control protein FliK [Syntrophorhabdaceae bacterium]
GEKNALKGSDAASVQGREPMSSASPSAPPAAGFAVAAETAYQERLVSERPVAMPQKTFDAGEHTFILTQKSDTSVEVTLSPPGVGKLNIEVVLNKGVINAHIVAADSTGVEAIERSLPRILQVLADEGIAVGGFNVSLKGGGQQEKEARQADEMPISDSAASVAPDTAHTINHASGLVNIFV